MIKTADKLTDFKTISRSSNSIIYEAFDVEANENVIIKTLNQELYDAKNLYKLKNEYKLLERLQGEYVVKAYEFLNVETRFSILIEDFGAVSLDRYLSTSQIGIREFLYIALETTKCLDHIHKNHVIHKDINPSNIVYNSDSKIIKLIDFGIASEFSFETMQALNPNKLEGRLSYISPEQTGRMNRPVDYRTDFYSLGVTLYELACSQLPFISDDPAEIVHCHIAKTPLPAYKVNPEIPKAVSGIIAKLMAKMPEERYKNTQGIMFDLYKCIEQMDDSGVVEDFELGSRDISDKFEVPKKLYGREYELDNLLTSFQNNKGNAEFILIGGYSGIGKTCLVNELHKPIMKEHGMFISGKYDQFNRNTPYSACLHAIDQFCNYILSEPETEIERWKKRISEALGSNGRLITEVVPRLGLIIGEQPALGELTPIEEQTRFKIALKNWMAVIAAPEHPVVFFMDDVHWADMASLDLFESLLMDQAIKGLMFVGTYRDNEVDSSHPLIRSIEKIRRNNGRIQFIKLENLDVNAVANIISDIVSRPEQEVLQLAGVVHERTLGNPFYTIEFLKHCNDKDLLYYDQGEMRWQWNETGICSSQISDNVADYLLEKIATLPVATSNLIKMAACIGNHFDVKVLSVVAGKDTEKIKDELKPAIYEEMVYVAENRGDNFKEMQFEFCHDKFQQAGYQALSDDLKKNIHLNIARYYEANEVMGGTYLFVVAEHYSKVLDCLVSKQEIEKVIEIFFKAAHAAYISSAYETARQYLELIMEIAPEDLKKNDSFLLRLYTEYHLVLFSLALFAELDQTYIKLEEIAKDPIDLVNACCIQLISLSNRSRFEEAVFLGVSLLEKLGVQYPKERLQEAIEVEFEKFYEFERNGSIDEMEKKEMLRDAKGKAIALLLNRIVPAAQFYNPMISFWAGLINTNLMIENGITLKALEICLSLLSGIIAYKDDFCCGNMLAKKAMSIAEREGFLGELYRMYHTNGLLRCHWFEPVERAIYYAHESFKGNLQNGEFEFSCYSYFTSQIAILECCNTVLEMQEEVAAAISFASKMGNLFGLESFVSFRQFVRALMGQTLSYGNLNDEDFNGEIHIENIQHNAIGLSIYYVYSSLSAVLFNDYQRAFTLADQAVKLLPYIAPFYIAALVRFLHSLSICKIMAGIKEPDEKQKLQNILEANQEWMYQRAKDAPFNFQHLYDLVDAEMKSLEGKYDESFRLYEKAILGAKENKRPYHYALACELAGQRYHQTGIDRIAGSYLKEAYSAFLEWGATGKTEAMKEKYQHILFSGMDSVKLVELSSETEAITNSINITTLTNSIDINAVIKATQTISREIEKTKLLEKLMNITIENSGSNRGYILIKDENRWILSAYEISNRILKIIIDDQEILLESIYSKSILPISIISYVIRTKEPLIIGNTQASQFSSDKYFSENTTSSVMCFPILSHNTLKGIVYLENDLLTEAFTKERLEILNIFASQAAISLENSTLYSNLEEKVNERTAELESANQTIREREERLRLVLEGITDGFWDWNIETGKIFRSGRWANILGYPAEEIEPNLHTWEKHIHPDDVDATLKRLNDYLDGRIPKYETEYRLLTETGELKWIFEHGRVISRNEKGEPLRMAGACSEITERKQAEAEIRYLSYHDKLTGLYNRTFFEEELQRINTNRQLPIGLIMGDVNGLKLINDALGHLEGDKVLIKAAELLRNSCRQEDIISRWGGDEFIILLPRCDSATALRVVKRINDSFIGTNGLPIQVNMSLGMAIQNSLDQNIRDVIREAEEIMYRNKLLESRSTRSSFIKSLEKTLWERSHETKEHCQRMQEMSQKMGRNLELTDSELDNLKLLAALHDIGKIAIPDSILDKPGKLSPEEWETVKDHPEIGYRIALSSPELAPIAEAILHHHEWWDGSGYPFGLKGEKIPLISRIIAITDAYDVMLNGRPYKKPLSKEEALAEIERCAGTQFDPYLARKSLFLY